MGIESESVDRIVNFGPHFMFQGGLHLVSLIIWLLFVAASIYGFILFIKLAHRGIKAMDIYIKKNKDL